VANKQPQQSLADYVTIALSPVLIMALVGSLIFFLLEVLYGGQYAERLRWTLFFYVVAVVLIARISIELGHERAGLYALGLGGAVFLALQAYVEYPPGSALASVGWVVNLGLMAISWWSAHRLVWDCTYIDDSVDSAGTGVLEAAGLDGQEATTPSYTPAEEVETKRDRGRPALVAWWDRYRRYRQEQSRKPHTPGVWVVYYSLAALPLYGLGQSLIPAEDGERRRYAFWLMACYVGSGLGLLLTTSFLGLRRYLRQRKLKMPAAMTGMWLALGGGLIVAVLVLGALLPRPYGEYQLLAWSSLGSKERDASRYAIQRDSSGKGDGQASSDPAKDEQEAKDGSGTKPGNSGQGKSSNKTSGGKSGKGGSGSGNKQGLRSGGKSSGKSGQESSSKGDPRFDGKQEQDSKEADQEKPRNQDDSDNEKRDDEQKREQRNSQSSGSSSSQSKSDRSSSTSSSRPSSPSQVLNFFSRLGGLAKVLKWIVFGVLILVVAFYVLRSGLQFLANFTNWARRLLDALRAWWAGLFGGSQSSAPPEEEMMDRAQRSRPRPFASFRNPFLDGSAEQMSPDEVARYSFEALQSWAWERGLGRQPEETPAEFAERLAEGAPALDTAGRRLAALYARSVYARGRLTSASLQALRSFWEQLENATERPLSA
jgi:hypothetical protein